MCISCVQIVFILPRYKLSHDRRQIHTTLPLMMNFSMKGGYTNASCAYWNFSIEKTFLVLNLVGFIRFGFGSLEVLCAKAATAFNAS